ncbi:ThiF family adenylyltransferase [Acrocarpospora sp. B8E8]|uniref:ThiF family adenylyltransferase n=1 Tax=Acrocarpospora sp. B8E8 TaxID=3153572 RepID=UPI00325C8546
MADSHPNPASTVIDPGRESTATGMAGRESAYDRQRLIPGWDQDRLAAATVVVAGVGAVGNEIAKNLALAGVGRLILCDPDTVSVTNLSRTVLFTPDDLHGAKAEAAAESLRRLVPTLQVEPRIAPLISGVGLGELADATLVVGAVDTIRARMQLLGRCALVGAALIDSGTQPWGGEVRFRPPQPDEPCYACTLTEHQRSHSDLPWSCLEPRDTGPEPASIAAAALVGAWATTAALEFLMGRPPAWRLLSVELSGRTGPVQIRRDPSCPYHHPWTDPPSPLESSAETTVAELLTEFAPEDEPETWTDFPLPLFCRVCGLYPQLADRHDGVTDRDHVRLCARCGALLRSVTSVRLRDAVPDLRLRELGVAPEEILPVRGAQGERRCVRLSRG